MAEPIPFPEATVTLGAPAGLESLVAPVHAAVSEYLYKDHNTPNAAPRELRVWCSCWKLSSEELEEIARTGVIWLSAMGSSMQPHRIDGSKPIRPAILTPQEMQNAAGQPLSAAPSIITPS